MSTVAKRSPISATAELLLQVCSISYVPVSPTFSVYCDALRFFGLAQNFVCYLHTIQQCRPQIFCDLAATTTVVRVLTLFGHSFRCVQTN